MKSLKSLKTSTKILLIAAAVLIPAGFVFAKYFLSNAYEAFLVARNFYFDSSILTTDNKSYTLKNWDGDAFTLNLDLNNILNESAWTAYAINYTITPTCPASVTCTVTSGTTGSLAYSAAAGTTNLVTVRIVPTGTISTGDSVTLSVSAVSTTAYRKTLSATFTLEALIRGVGYTIEDSENSPYATFILYNTSADSKTLSLTFDPSDLLIDTTNSAVISGVTTTDSANNVNSLSLTLAANSEVAIKFFKTDISSDYTYPLTTATSAITVTETGGNS